ncbi:MAG: hypothetical protein MUE60_01150 [Candidatus Eisenbacteria bacterium]|jgi:hypothetical protein|nr:hypothetical protein [Candidatus Eisenbacteria bacterium]
MRKRLMPWASVLAMAPLAYSATFWVEPDGSGDYPTIQAAINAASPSDEIVLGDGVFTGDGNRNIDFVGKAVTVRSQSGDPATCVIDVQGNFDYISDQGFSFHSGEGPGSVVRDLTITNAVADGA